MPAESPLSGLQIGEEKKKKINFRNFISENSAMFFSQTELLAPSWSEREAKQVEYLLSLIHI